MVEKVPSGVKKLSTDQVDSSLSEFSRLYLRLCGEENLRLIWNEAVLPYLQACKGGVADFDLDCIEFKIRNSAIVKEIRSELNRAFLDVDDFYYYLLEFEGMTNLEATKYIDDLSNLRNNYLDFLRLAVGETFEVDLREFLWLLHRGSVVKDGIVEYGGLN